MSYKNSIRRSIDYIILLFLSNNFFNEGHPYTFLSIDGIRHIIKFYFLKQITILFRLQFPFKMPIPICMSYISSTTISRDNNTFSKGLFILNKRLFLFFLLFIASTNLILYIIIIILFFGSAIFTYVSVFKI